jgi:hypothetical protein
VFPTTYAASSTIAAVSSITTTCTYVTPGSAGVESKTVTITAEEGAVTHTTKTEACTVCGSSQSLITYTVPVVYSTVQFTPTTLYATASASSGLPGVNAGNGTAPGGYASPAAMADTQSTEEMYTGAASKVGGSFAAVVVGAVVAGVLML